MDTDMEGSSSVDDGGGKAAPTGGTVHTSDRGELIERIKRGESPTWVPNPAVRCEGNFFLHAVNARGANVQVCRFRLQQDWDYLA